VFLAEIEKRKSDQDEVDVAGNPLDERITWAKRRTATLDPLNMGVDAMFDAISKAPSGLSS
jgi:hypothetical protein